MRAEIESRRQGQRLTPAHRRIAQCLIEHTSEIGFLSSIELARLANVSQPSVTRFAATLGYDGFLEMRRCLRSGARTKAEEPTNHQNRFQVAALAESRNLCALSETLGDLGIIQRFGQALAGSRPLPVFGLRAASALAMQFHYFGAKVHPDIRLIACGGSMMEDEIEQALAAGATHLLAFLMPLYPREAVQALRLAKQAGLRVAIVAETNFDAHPDLIDLALLGRIDSSLVFDSYASATLLVSVLLDAMCDALGGDAQRRLEATDQSSKKRKVFIR